MNLRISVTAAVAVFLASLSLNAVLQGNGWLTAGFGAIVVVAAAGVATRLSSMAGAVAVTVMVVLGVVPLLSASTWPVRATGLVIIVLTAASATGRRVLRAFATLAGYLAALLIYLNLVFANAYSFGRIIPSPHSVTVLGRFVPLAFDDFKFSPPVPDARPVSLVAAAGIGLVAVAVDIVAVRIRRPALAGVPLLVLFCVPIASNLKTFGVKQTAIFAVALAGFLALLSADGRMRLRMWGRLVTFRYVQSADEAGTGPDTRELAASGRRIGLAAVCLAVMVPFVLPAVHAHDIFGTTDNGSARDSGGGLDAFLQVQRDLSQQPQPVFSYSTDASDPADQYFQVYVLNYSNSSGTWLPEFPNGVAGSRPILGPVLPYSAPGLLASTPTTTVKTNVTMAPRQGALTAFLPVPYSPASLQIKGFDWLEYAGSLMILSSTESLSDLTYSVTSREADPTKTAIDNTSQFVPGTIQGQYGSYAGPDAARLLTIARDHTQGALTLLQAAVDLQNWFQSGAFTYTLKPNLPTSHWLLHFLTTDRRGYCQQFAWAFAVLARLVGIPSRVAVGYTGGSPAGGGVWHVTTADAHAWPELYFPGQGWLRFEPTPHGSTGQGTATVPSYAKGPSTGPDAALPGGSSPSQAGASASAGSGRKSQVLKRLVHGQPGVAGPAAITSGSGLWLVIGVPLLILLLIVAPALTRRLTRRRRWLAASGDAGQARAAWRELTDDLADLGLPSHPGETPRALVGRIGVLSGFDPDSRAALRRIAAAEERGRYARLPLAGTGLPADVRAVRRAAAASASRRQRARAILLPASTLMTGRRLLERAGSVLGWLESSWPAVRRQIRRALALRST